MGWNRPNENASSRRVRKLRLTKCSAILGTLVFLGAGIVAWWLWCKPERGEDVRSEKKISRIKEVTPAKAAKNSPASEKKKDPPGYYNGKPISESNRPPWMCPYHRIVDYGPSTVVDPGEALLADYEKPFSNSVDRKIAMFVGVEPGAPFLGDGAGLYNNFKERFLEAIKTPIVINRDDSDYVKELKQSVIDLRKMLKERHDKGEDIQKVMEDADRELRELGLYKEELRKQVDSICSGREITEQDVRDCVDAANTMLKDRGCSLLKFEDFYRRGLRIRSLRARQGGQVQ